MWYSTYGTIEIMEQTFYQARGGRLRPFLIGCGIEHKRCSMPLQRVLVDFGAEYAFNQVHHHVKEHYGISLPDSLPRRMTLKHAQAMIDAEQRQLPSGQPRSCIISETDGSMVPIVSIDQRQADKRKKKTVGYREARLTLAREKGSVTPVFAATLKDVATTGQRMAACIHRIGIGADTYLHSLGDGAPWIAEQMDVHFGSQAHYLVDFYHVCEYLAQAAPRCSVTPAQWLEEQKQLLKSNQAEQVIETLGQYKEPEAKPDKDAPVRVCYRYLSNRLHQLDYQTAIQKDLPIGSGEIESAHRYVIQKRLKLPGAWWLEEHAEDMLALRTLRANNDWADYWKNMAA